MYKRIEYLYLTFRILISTVFETMTCRTKPEGYQPCDYEEQENPPDIFL
jgi:hypothetical protein